MSKSSYIPFIKFRTANHKLPVETGRRENIPHAERKCSLCNKNDIGDEFHYLLICLYFATERTRTENKLFPNTCRPLWLSWMRRPTRRSRVQPPPEVGNILSWRLIMNYFLWSFSSLPQEGQLSVSGERMCTILVNRLED